MDKPDSKAGARREPSGDAAKNGQYEFTPLEHVLSLAEDELAGHETPARRATPPVHDPGEEIARFSPDGGSTEEADLAADIYPIAPSAGRRLRRASVTQTDLDLEARQMQRGTHPGDRRVQVRRPAEDGFKRTSAGHLEALPRTMEPTSGMGRVFNKLKRVLIGSPLSTAAAAHERLSKVKALAVLSSDALSSVTYATEAILATLLVAGSAAFGNNIPIAIAIAVLITVVVFSYRQTIYAYPKGGGSYIVSKDNLGTLPGLVGGASLLTGYILTVAVSIAAGVANLISLAQTMNIADLRGWRVELALAAVAILVLLNLRGIKESGTIFSAPTYIFLVLVFAMIGMGLYQFAMGTLGHVSGVPDLVPPGDKAGAIENVGLFLLLRAFAAGCSALTGIEAISDGVPAFEKPESKNAAQTLVTLGVLLIGMFLGISFLAANIGVQISHTETVVSQLGRVIFGPGPVYTMFLLFTALLLVLAANTAFADFPRLGFFLARDRFLPHQFSFRGDRLAFSFGIITLGVMAGILVIIFGGSIEGLLPLYAIGVFTSFTLSQSGMVMRWWRLRPPGWQLSLAFNAAGALTTLGVAIILAITRFSEGAWLVMVIVPGIVWVLLRINKHYESVRGRLSLQDVPLMLGRAAADGRRLPPNLRQPGDGSDLATMAADGNALEPIQHLVVMPIASLNQVTLRTLSYARSIADNVVAVHVAADEEKEQTEKLEEKWHKWVPDVPLIIVDSPYRSLLRPLVSYIDALHRQQPNTMLTVLIPEFMSVRWWENLLHNQSALRLKGSLLFRPGIVVTSVPYHIDTTTQVAG
jgi:amino acid transporter